MMRNGRYGGLTLMININLSIIIIFKNGHSKINTRFSTKSTVFIKPLLKTIAIILFLE